MRFLLGFFLILSSLYGFEIDLDAKSAILMNAENGRILFEKKSRELSYPGSLTKVATALYVLEKEELDFNRIIEPSNDALLVMMADVKQADFTKYPSHRLEHDGINLGLRKQEKLPLWAAFYGMLLASGNDCANAVAEAFAPTIPDFMDKVNAYLKEIGLEETYFMNPHGLHHPDHISTAYDLALLAKKALQNDNFREILSFKSFQYPKTNKQKERKVSQGNRLVKESSRYFYAHATGMKTGYHKRAGSTLIGSAEKDGRTLIAVVLGGSTKVSRYVDAKKLFERAFEEKEQTRLILSEGKKYRKALEGGSVPLLAFLKDGIKISYFPSEEPQNIRAFIYWNDLTLPIEKNAVVGNVRVFSGEELLGESSLYAQEEVKKTFTFAIKDFFSNLFRSKKKSASNPPQ